MAVQRAEHQPGGLLIQPPHGAEYAEFWRELGRGRHQAGVYRRLDRDGREVDLVLERDGVLHPIEVKRSANPQASAAKSFSALDRSTLERGTGAIACMKQEVGALPNGALYFPAWAI